jgi:hypothetical protein
VVVDTRVAAALIGEVGDFVVAFRVAQAWARHVGVGEWCAAGAWVGWLYESTVSRFGDFALSPGDIDEASAAVLATDAAGLESVWANMSEFETGVRTLGCERGVFADPDRVPSVVPSTSRS